MTESVPIWKPALVCGFVLGSLLTLFLVPPIAQDPTYHSLADTRQFLGIPNFWNVVSNLPFLLVGWLGIRAARVTEAVDARLAWQVLFIGIGLVGVGSSWYHWAPDSARLVWDRLPITVGFMGLLVAMLAEVCDGRLSRLLIPAVLLGIVSVMVWAMTGDLRLYGWVQFMPLGVLLLLLVMYRAPYTRSGLLWLALAGYALAKVFEHFDAVVFEVLRGTLSGHTLKHFAAAAGCWALVVMLATRERCFRDPS